MFSLFFYCLLLTVNLSNEFDAGFIQFISTRKNEKDTTHYGITVCGISRVTIDYLKSVYKIDVSHLNTKFDETKGQCSERIINDIVDLLKRSQTSSINPWEYSRTVKTIASSNTKTDLKELLKEESHFDSETFPGGSKLILKRYQLAVDSILKDDNFDQARKSFGEMLHTLQDFYSHTNFIELNYQSPSNVLGQRVFQQNEYATSNTRTCISCKGEQCQTSSNLDANIQKKKLLTSGYFIPIGVSLFTKKKPKGKCSHGGTFDTSQNSEPTGGINKDKLDSIHGHLHYRAASMAYQATVNILTKFRNDIGDQSFATFLTLKKNLNSLVISIDTTCTIGDYVTLAKDISIDIVNQYEELEYAPHNYILITFNSDQAQMIVDSQNPRDLINSIENIQSCQKNNSTQGEMYYHSLVEALKNCEASSVIYAFTDSPARDAYLKHQARALLRSKQTVIYLFMGQQMKTKLFKVQSDLIDLLDGTDDNLDLASISGGVTYPITKNDRSVVSEFILHRLEWTRLQTLLIAKSKSSSNTFYVDSSIDELYLDVSSMGEMNDLNQIELLQPDGSRYSLETNLSNTTHLYMWKIPQPKNGLWHLTTFNLSNEFNHNIQIQGKTNITCSSTLQKQMEANTDTSGYTQLTTEPIINSNLLILTTCENVNFTNANIFLINQQGQIIGNYTPTESNQFETLTKLTVPDQPFRIGTILTLSSGTNIQRIEKQLILPTMFSIELTNQPYIVSPGETAQMNYTIKSFKSAKVTVRLQIMDTLNLINNQTVEKNFTFTNQTSETHIFTLPKNYQQRTTNNIIIFGLSTFDLQTKKILYENDETVPVYFELNSSSISKTINYFAIFLSLFFIIL